MSYRDQWKMLHLLNTTKDKLHKAELKEMGIDCVPDTIQHLANLGIVKKTNDYYSLSPVVSTLLNTFLIGMGPRNVSEIYVDVPVCFVIMPFREKWSGKVFNNLIKFSLKDSNMDCIRGDLIPRIGKLSENVIKHILKAGLVIAEISSPNPNVYYELGMADMIGRDVLLLFDKNCRKQLPADIRGAHYLSYDRKDLDNSRIQLTKMLQKWKKDSYVDGVKKYLKS